MFLFFQTMAKEELLFFCLNASKVQLKKYYRAIGAFLTGENDYD